MNLTEYFEMEERLREDVKKLNPNHESLKKIHSSTYEAIDEYTKVLTEFNNIYIKKCLNCNKEFKTKSKYIIYCSYVCELEKEKGLKHKIKVLRKLDYLMIYKNNKYIGMCKKINGAIMYKGIFRNKLTEDEFNYINQICILFYM